MSKQRKTYTREFKLEAVRLAETNGRPITQVERELGLSQGTIAHWRREGQQNGGEAFPGHGHLLPSEERLRQLERENAILRQERDILKKAIAVVSQKPQ
jgi:transposase